MPFQEPSRFRRLLSIGALCSLTTLLLSSCGLPDEVRIEFTNLRHQLEEIQISADTQSHRIGRIEEFLTYCPDEVQPEGPCCAPSAPGGGVASPADDGMPSVPRSPQARRDHSYAARDDDGSSDKVSVPVSASVG